MSREKSIYRITNSGYIKCYIGSTCEKLSKRMERHRQAYSKYNRGKTNKRISVFDVFDEFGVEDCKVELIENYPCSSKEELLRREGHYIKNWECVNKNIPHRTDRERKDLALDYYYKNKDTIAERRLEKVQCPLCQGWFSNYYLKIHIQTKKAHPEEEQ